MFDQDLLESLPSDPEDAFGVFEATIRARIPAIQEFQEHYDQRSFDLERTRITRDYILALAAFAEVYNFNMGVNFEELMTLEDASFDREFKIASAKIQYFSNKCAIQLAQRKKKGTTCIYVLEEKSKLKIQQYIEGIRELILSADLTDLKKEALLTKLNSFSLEVDKDRTRIEALASFYVLAKSEAKELIGISDKVEKIWVAVSKGKELWKALPSIEITARLNAPQKKIEDKSTPTENFDLDDEIPF
ncbi:hypothetical protein [Litorimonas sp.]|uniref:hypothetical protein n=1 Tax=Litorimonas sp. TaxID=1892381 RepID=UPI003A85BC48